jgi:hypothetical protein
MQRYKQFMIESRFSQGLRGNKKYECTGASDSWRGQSRSECVQRGSAESELDVLAFSASKVFRLHSGLMPVDLRIAHDTGYGLYTHSAYWGCSELVTAIQQTVRP